MSGYTPLDDSNTPSTSGQLGRNPFDDQTAFSDFTVTSTTAPELYEGVPGASTQYTSFSDNPAAGTQISPPPIITNEEASFSTQPETPPSTPSGNISAAPGGMETQQPKKVHFWNVAYYQHLFNVETKDVTYRLLRSVMPFKTDFISALNNNADLYGPFWVATTVIFLMAACGNLASYLDYFLHDDVGDWEYDFSKVSYGAIVIYGYLVLLSLVVWGVSRFAFKAKLRLVEVLCVYGYSFFIYAPLSVFCIIPIELARWLVVMGCGVWSTAFLLASFFPVLKPVALKRGLILLAVMGACHLALALAFKLYFFEYSDLEKLANETVDARAQVGHLITSTREVNLAHMLRGALF